MKAIKIGKNNKSSRAVPPLPKKGHEVRGAGASVISNEIGYGRFARRAYGFDEVAIVPGTVTLNPEDVDVSTQLGPHKLKIPVLASAMDGAVDAPFASLMSSFGGLAVLNLDGVATRYKNPQEAIEKIVTAHASEVARVVQEVYSQPLQEDLIARRVKEIKKRGGLAAVSTVPQNAKRFAELAKKAGADFFVIQATVVTTRHGFRSADLQPFPRRPASREPRLGHGFHQGPLDLTQLIHSLKIPVILGNCVTFEAAWELTHTGCAGLLVGLGPGSACTSRQVLGVGVPQVTAISDAAWAREEFYKKTGKRVCIIADGGMSTGGDICKAVACGADAVMLGSAMARAKEAPGKGYHWGMAMPSRYLPRGTRIYVGTSGTLEEILLGPATKDDGTQNLVGALQTCMGYVGASTLREMQKADLVIAPEIRHEGKLLQKAQKVGMG